MSSMTNTRKQTAANNELLRTIKQAMNARIYKHASDIMNSHGEEATLTYLQQFFTVPIDADFLKRFIAKHG
jgi:hypothetical protein